MNIGLVYQYIYLLLCTVKLTKSLRFAKNPSSLVSNVNSLHIESHIGFVFFLILWLGLRPVTRQFGDTAAYNEMYQFVYGVPFKFTFLTGNIIFDNLFSFWGSLRLPISSFFILIAAIYFLCIYLASRKLFPENSNIAFFSYLVGFSTYAYGTNGIKAGAAAAIFLVALAYKENKKLFFLLVLVSMGFHHSMFVVGIACVMSCFIKKTKLFFFGWLFALVIAALHINYFQDLFSSFGGDSAADYLKGQGEVVYMTGFRVDFILYSFAPVLIGYHVCFRQRIRNDKYEFLLRMYLTTNAVWMLCMYASFTNRIAYLSWLMYPFVLIYPYFAIRTSRNQIVIGKKVAVCHLYFTLFMDVIFYTFIK